MPIAVKNTTLPGIFDLLAPHVCLGCGRVGAPLCDCCKKYIISAYAHVCPNCKNRLDDAVCPNCANQPVVYAVGARAGLLDVIIRSYKYQPVRGLAKTLAELLDGVLPRDFERVVVVPLPTATHHVRARGFDHTLLIARKFAKMRGYSVQRMLVREKNTVQVGADQETRVVQANQAFRLNSKICVSERTTYLLIDDVWTTGATVRAATRLLSEAGVKNLVVAILAYSV